MNRLCTWTLLIFVSSLQAFGQEIVAMAGSVSPRASRMQDRGPADPATKLGSIRLIFKQSSGQKAALAQLLSEQQDPNSPQFHKWLTPEQYADRYGASQVSIDRVAAWLTSEGFTVDYRARGRDWIAFTGTAAQVESAFHTGVHRYESNGESHIAISTEPSVPRELAPLIQSVLGLDDFRPHAMSRPAFTSGGQHSLAPGDLATIYSFSRLYSAGIDGTGQKIVIVGQTNVTLSDIQTFRTQYGLGTANIQVVQTGTDPGFQSKDLVEADLDLEWSGAVARNASIIYVYSTSADYSASYAIDQNLAPVISESFGTCEANVGSGSAPAYETAAQKANSMGITWIASSDDSGAAGCDYDATEAVLGLAVAMPASVPEVTAVGGTEFNEGAGTFWSTANGANGGSALSYIPEMAWNDTAFGQGIASTGGGVSTLYNKPSWQTGLGVPADGKRDVPDVAMPAANDHDPYNVVSSGQAGLVGGTSAAAPVFAGLIALLNQYTKTNGQGNVNINLYKLALSNPGIFHDVATGNNIVPCAAGTPNCVNGSFGYSATLNYDLTTGLGSVDGYNLATGWSGTGSSTLSITSVSPASATAGSAAFTLTVNGSGFASGASVLWNGTALNTAFVSATQLTASVTAALVASAGVASITVSSGGKTSGVISFTISAPATQASYSNQRVTTQAPPSSGCVLPASDTSFAVTDGAVYLYFTAATTTSDLLSNDWLAPDGSVVAGASWQQETGSYCFTGASLAIANLGSNKLGAWQARVYDNGKILFTVPFTVSGAGAALPVITSLKNAASYVSGTVSPGEIVVLIGTGMGPATLALGTFNGSGGTLAAQVSGTTVTFNGVAAPLIYSSATAVAAIVPYEIGSSSAVQVVVSYQSRTSAALSIPVVASVPGIFTANSSGTGAAAALNQNGILNTASAPAIPGSTIVIYATGEGLLTPSGVDGKPATAPVPRPVLPVTVFIGGVSATIAYAGSAPGEVEGLMQINAVIPAGAYGASVPIVVQVGTAQSQTGTTIAVAPPNSGFTVTSQFTTAAPPEDSSGNLLCNTTPVAKNAFLTTDPTVWVWFTFNGAVNGDVLTFNWIHPSGAVDSNQPNLAIPFNGSGCAAYPFSISGHEAATEPGNWQIVVLRDGVRQFSLTFSISTPPPTFSVTQSEMTGALVTDASGNPNYCAVPTAKSSFLNTDPDAIVWFTYNGVQTGDVFSFNWIHPSGAVDSYQPATTSTFSGSGCTAWSFNIAGLSRDSGSWQVRVFRNGTSILTLPFTIAAPAAFSVTSDATAAALVTTSTGGLSCTTPALKTAFLTTDASMSVYFSYDNVQNGDVMSFNWVHPSGLVDGYQPSTTVPFTGSGCTGWTFNIAGQEAAREPGVWNVRVFRNGGLIFSLPFTIATPGGFVLTSELTAGGVSTSTSGGLICAAPSAKVSFLTTDPAVYVYFTYNNVVMGDVFTYNWIHPSGQVDSYQPSSTLTFSGSGCSEWFLNIAGQNRESGAWQVRVLRNGSPVLTLPFSIGN